ncbi:peptidylprolyl isomerase domain and WD repeat-containing protein 1-like [Teleopsis dalmanni]|uniref:peptidylprolyl isomerase domain and WD repeat-containing protein 1-like n=1 Tax=Teleopsis dalmanni TaxID=139649 RepID=UPI0018CDF51B|nr:peptidylprolyl isomerase domain and WD repeat-containing protein 1-like [Teleopsis dalmanni]
MSTEEIDNTLKRAAPNDNNSDEDADDGGWIGPLPCEQIENIKPKKKKILPYEQVYLENLPNAESYEKSYMHRDVITHLVSTKTDFIITGSIDGHIKFWKKMEEGIEFVKHFRSHLLPLHSLTANASGTLLCSASADKCAKIFDVVNFDMINIIRLGFIPLTTEWIHSPGDAVHSLAISDTESNKIYIYDGEGNGEILHCLDKLHSAPVIEMCFNVAKETVISVDKNGILEYWQNSKNDYAFPQKLVNFDSKLDTSLFEFAKSKTLVTGLACTQNGRRFAAISTDRKVRLFNFNTGKLVKVFDEALTTFTQMQQTPHALPNMEFGRRMATERDLEKSEFNTYSNILFDDSGYFLMYPTMLGIKVLNIETNRCVSILGKTDNIRPIQITLLQGKSKRTKAAITLEQEASDNPALQSMITDPTIFCTAYKKQRFFLYSRRLPSDLQDVDRDVFNEKPSKEDIIAVPEGQDYEEGMQRLYENVILHTTMDEFGLDPSGSLEELRKKLSTFMDSEAAEKDTARLQELAKLHIRSSSPGVIENRRPSLTKGGSLTMAEYPVIINQVRKWECHYSGEHEILPFIERIEELADMYGIHRDLLPKLMPEVLKDKALIWFRNNNKRWTEWPSFKADILAFFLPPRYFEQLEDKIRARLQQPRELFRDYVLALQNIMQYSTYSEEIKLERIYRNSRTEYQWYIRRKDFQSLSELLTLAGDLEALTATDRQQRNSMGLRVLIRRKVNMAVRKFPPSLSPYHNQRNTMENPPGHQLTPSQQIQSMQHYKLVMPRRCYTF